MAAAKKSKGKVKPHWTQTPAGKLILARRQRKGLDAPAAVKVSKSLKSLLDDVLEAKGRLAKATEDLAEATRNSLT